MRISRAVAVTATAACLVPLSAARAASGSQARRLVPCGRATTERQRLASDTLRARAVAQGLAVADEPASGRVGDIPTCSGQSWATRSSFAFVLKQYSGHMASGCNYPIDMCNVALFSSTTVPQFGWGTAIPGAGELHCEARTLLQTLGLGTNFTDTIGSCLSNGVIWVDPSPEQREWS
jgi:hypothetical protein